MNPKFHAAAVKLISLLSEGDSDLPDPPIKKNEAVEKDDDDVTNSDSEDTTDVELPDPTDGGGNLNDVEQDPLETLEPEPAYSPREQLFTSVAVEALMFDPKQIRPKDLVVYDLRNPEEIFSNVRRIIGSSTTLANFPQEGGSANKGSMLPGNETPPPTEDSSERSPITSDGNVENFLSGQKHAVASLMLKALKYDPDDVIMQSDLISQQVDATNARELQHQLETLIGHDIQ